MKQLLWKHWAIMMSDVTNIRMYRFSRDDRLFLDANIWLYLYGPYSPDNKEAKTYSPVLKNIREAGSRVYINIVVISEFINTFARIRFKQLFPDKKASQFKEFRKSKVFKTEAEDITINVKKILAKTYIGETCFSSEILFEIMDEFSDGEYDFNDQVIAKTCIDNGFRLITNDTDFKKYEIDILTANNVLLS